jgi:hypothetical protein
LGLLRLQRQPGLRSTPKSGWRGQLSDPRFCRRLAFRSTQKNARADLEHFCGLRMGVQVT